MKRTPASNAENAVRAMVNSTLAPLKPPKHCKMRPGDEPFWDGIISARAREEWTRCDMVVAAQLARCQADIETESAALEEEESTKLNGRGTMVFNPRLNVLELLSRREMALMRTLRMGGRVAGDSRDEAGRRKLQDQATAVREEFADDELLAV